MKLTLKHRHDPLYGDFWYYSCDFLNVKSALCREEIKQNLPQFFQRHYDGFNNDPMFQNKYKESMFIEEFEFDIIL